MTNPTPAHVPNWCPFCGALLADPVERSGTVPCVSCKRPLWFTRAPDGVWFHDPADVAAIRARVVRVVCENLGVNPDEITDAMSFTGNIGADTLDIVEFVMELEEEFGVTIPDRDAERMVTVGDVVSYFLRRSR
jgi:acyl carrier protein